MFRTLLIPDYAHDPELAKRSLDMQAVLFEARGYRLSFEQSYGCRVIAIADRLESLPATLVDISMERIILSKRNSTSTLAADGSYADGNITARVDSFVVSGVRCQDITVTGVDGVTLEQLNQWLDDLIVGEHSDKNARTNRFRQ